MLVCSWRTDKWLLFCESVLCCCRSVFNVCGWGVVVGCLCYVTCSVPSLTAARPSASYIQFGCHFPEVARINLHRARCLSAQFEQAADESL
jgi:hypothetical protein